MKPDTNNTVPRVIGEGRVTRIDILAKEASSVSQLKPEEDSSPIVFRLVDPVRGFWLDIYDHRQKVRRAFSQSGPEGAKEAFQDFVPCLAGYRAKGKTQYIAINDIGTLDMRDGGEGEALILTRGGCFNRQSHRVIVTDGKPAIHAPTKICLVEPRPPKTPK